MNSQEWVVIRPIGSQKAQLFRMFIPILKYVYIVHTLSMKLIVLLY